MKDESLNEFTQLKREMDGCDLKEIAIYISLRTPRRTPPPLTCSRSPIPKGSRSATTCLARILPAHMRTARQRTWRHNRAARGGSSGGRRKAEGATNGIIIPEVNVASPAPAPARAPTLSSTLRRGQSARCSWRWPRARACRGHPHKSIKLLMPPWDATCVTY